VINFVFGLFYLLTYFSTPLTTSDGGHLHASEQSHRLIGMHAYSLIFT